MSEHKQKRPFANLIQGADKEFRRGGGKGGGRRSLERASEERERETKMERDTFVTGCPSQGERERERDLLERIEGS